MDDFGYQTCPATLMTCAQAPSGICIKELVERDIFSPMRVVVEHVIAIVDRSSTIIAASEKMLQPLDQSESPLQRNPCSWYLHAAILPPLGPNAYILLNHEGILPAKTYHNTNSSAKACQVRKQQYNE